MELVVIIVLVAGLWVVSLLTILMLCRVASLGDRALRLERAAADSHNFGLPG